MGSVATVVEALEQVDLRLQFDPEGWVALHKSIPLWLGGGLVAFGLLACLFGSHKILFRAVLTPLALVLGLRLGPQLAELAHLKLSAQLSRQLAAALLSAAALAYPPIVLFLGFGALGGLLGGEIAGNDDYWMGFGPGFFIGGLLAVALEKIVAVIVSSLIGAATFVLGLITVASATSLGGLATRWPTIDVAAAAALAVLSMAYQFRFGPREKGDERIDEEKIKKRRAKEKEAEDAARMKRFEEYARKSKGQ